MQRMFLHCATLPEGLGFSYMVIFFYFRKLSGEIFALSMRKAEKAQHVQSSSDFLIQTDMG